MREGFLPFQGKYPTATGKQVIEDDSCVLLPIVALDLVKSDKFFVRSAFVYELRGLTALLLLPQATH